MRTIKSLLIPQEIDYVKFPDSTIKNETETENGTPVIREIYGDILTNFYAFLRDRGLTPNQLEDNKINGYQLLEALKKNVNVLNDSEQVLSLLGTTWNLPLDLSLLVDKYFCFARVSDNLDNTLIYDFKGSGLQTLPFLKSSKFKAGDELLLIIDLSGVRYHNISAASQSSLNDVFTVFGTPLPYNESTDKIWYQEQGVVFNDLPESHDLQNTLRINQSEPDLLVYECVSFKKCIICLTFIPLINSYQLWKFDYSDFNNPVEINTSGFAFGNSNNFKMHFYFDGEFAFFTNSSNNSINENEIDKCIFDLTNNLVTLVSIITIDSSFTRSTNAIVNNNGIAVLIDGKLTSFNFSGSVVALGDFNSFIGNIFKLEKDTFYTNGEVAKKWLIQN